MQSDLVSNRSWSGETALSRTLPSLLPDSAPPPGTGRVRRLRGREADKRRKRRRRKTAAIENPCRLAREFASIFLDIPVVSIEGPNRAKKPICEARHVAIYVAHVVFQVALNDVADSFGRDRSSVGHALRRVEDRRDDPQFEELMCRIERLAALIRGVAGGGRR